MRRAVGFAGNVDAKWARARRTESECLTPRASTICDRDPEWVQQGRWVVVIGREDGWQATRGARRTSQSDGSQSVRLVTSGSAWRD